MSEQRTTTILNNDYDARPRHPVMLPSKGVYYHAAGFQGDTINVLELTTQEEKILAQPKANPFTVFHELMKRLIHPSNWVRPDPANGIRGFSYDDLLMTDHLYLFLQVRNISIGPDYEFQVGCPECRTKFTQKLRIPDALECRQVTEIPDAGVEPFDVEIEGVGTVQCQLLRVGMEMSIQKRAAATYRKSTERGNPAHALRMAHLMCGVNGEKFETLLDAQNFYNGLTFRAAQEIRDAIAERDVGVLLERGFECPSCGAEFEATMPLNSEFFRPQRKESPRYY